MKKTLTALTAVIALASTIAMTSCANPSGGGSGTPPAIPSLAPSGIDYSLAKVGDIILQDGSICKPNDFNSATMTAVAVIFREMSASKCAVGIALSEAKNKPWCLNTAAGYNSIPTLTNGGCQDSREAYAKLAAACASDIATTGNYPAWEYCVKYGVTQNLPAPFNVGWCLPSYVELRDLVTNSVNVSVGLSKAHGTGLTTTPFVKTGLETINGQRQDVGNESYYVSCNQSLSNATCIDFGTNVNNPTPSEYSGDKYDGKSSYNRGDARIKNVYFIARPVFHFANTSTTLCAPVISNRSSGSVTIKSFTPGATIYYQIDGGEWISKPAPATITVNDDANHTVKAYTAKDGCHNSATVEKTFPQGGVY